MKRVFTRVVLLLTVVATCLTASAQMEQMTQPLPIDENVRIGKLDNGLTYYIRHNEKPKGQADFYIAQKVGSILEEDNQRGLAHFLEHMCFNGTENFPGNSLISWLESKGVKFGVNLNAYTGVDQTVYNIANVPIADTNVQDSVLMILHDWADGLLLDPAEIDKERKVIHEEWRTVNVGQMRILERLLPTMYPDSKYGYRLPIGTMEVVDNFPPQVLRDYYETWYRPDQQGIIVVGDIDVDRIEGKIKELFAPIKMPANPKTREYFPVPDHKGTIYAMGTDPEQPTSIVQLVIKHDALPDSLNNTIMGYVTDYANSVIDQMFNNRLNEISTRPDAPFSIANSSIDNYMLSKTKDALTLVFVPKDNDMIGGLKALYREALRAGKGFTASEYQRAKDEYMSHIEKTYNSRNDLDNDHYVQQYVNGFVDNAYILSPEQEYQMAQMFTAMLPVEAINAMFAEYITPDNRVLMILAPDGTQLPTEQQLTEALAAVDAETIEPYVDEVKAEPLIPQLPTPGTVTSTSDNAQWGTQEWTLSNGAKVIIKPTQYKADEIRFMAVAKGGSSELPDEVANSLIALPLASEMAGLGDYTNSDLAKYLQGKQANVSFNITPYNTTLNGMTTPKDLPTLMELIYMTMKDFEMTEDEFTAFQNSFSGILANQESNPQFVFQKKIAEELFASPKKGLYTADAIKGANRQQMLDIVHNATANAANFTFIFVGNIDPQTLKPLVEQYIASLPGDPATAVKSVKWNDSVEMKAGRDKHVSTMKMETPQTWALVAIDGQMPYTIKNHKAASVASQILTKRLLNTVREDEGAVYSIYAQGGLDYEGKYPASIMIPFPLKPELTDKVLGMIDTELQNMTKDVTPDELKAVQEYLVKQYTENKEKNESWLSALTSNVISGGVDVFNGNIEAVSSLTVDDIHNYMKQLLDQNNYQIVLLQPAE